MTFLGVLKYTLINYLGRLNPIHVIMALIIVGGLIILFRYKKWITIENKYLLICIFYYTFLLVVTIFCRRMGSVHNSIDKLFITYLTLLSGNKNEIYEIIFNIILFIPLGFINYYSIRKDRLYLLFLVSPVIEIFQLITSSGVFEICDLIDNNLGVLIGLYCAKKLLFFKEGIFYMKSNKMDTSIEFRHNCLNTIRLLGALEVMYGHSKIHLEIFIPYWIDTIISYLQGVPIFFALSGFLIWNSIGNGNNFFKYLKNRFFRIYPELWLSVLIENITIILFCKNINWLLLLLFIFTQSTIFQFWTPSFLRNFGCGTPNGSLWTIGIIVQFYIIAWFLKKYFTNKDYKVWGYFFILAYLLCAIPNILVNLFPVIINKLYGQLVLKYLWLFLIGMIISEFRDNLLPILKKYWYSFIGISCIFYMIGIDIPFTGNYPLLKSIFMILGVIGFAYRYPEINVKTDLSYGIYIYHMTIINIMLILDLKNKVILLFVVFLVTIIASIFSYWLIGAHVYRRNSKYRT